MTMFNSKPAEVIVFVAIYMFINNSNNLNTDIQMKILLHYLKTTHKLIMVFIM